MGRHLAMLLLLIFKTAVLVWKCLHNAAPRHLADLCVLAASTDGRRQSRSAVSSVHLVPWTRMSTGQRNFAAYGPRTWSRLPSSPITRTVALFIQAPAQDPPVPANRQCWLQLWMSCTVVDVRRCCDCTASSAPTTNVQTRLDLLQFSIRPHIIAV